MHAVSKTSNASEEVGEECPTCPAGKGDGGRRYFMGDKFENAQFQKDIQAGLIDPAIAYESFMWYADKGLAFASSLYPSGRILSLFGTTSKFTVQFGKNSNQIYHTFRHVESMGLNTNVVNSGILKDIPGVAKNMPYGQAVRTTISVSGHKIIYTSYKLPNGIINIGRITGLIK